MAGSLPNVPARPPPRRLGLDRRPRPTIYAGGAVADVATLRGLPRATRWGRVSRQSLRVHRQGRLAARRDVPDRHASASGLRADRTAPQEQRLRRLRRYQTRITKPE